MREINLNFDPEIPPTKKQQTFDDEYHSVFYSISVSIVSTGSCWKPRSPRDV